MPRRRSQLGIVCTPRGGIQVMIPDRGHPGEVKTTCRHCYQIGGQEICIPANYWSDLASVPRWLLFAFDPFGNHQRWALLHDYLYREQIYSRVIADAFFCDGMESRGLPCWRRKLLYLGVRLFGWYAWKKNAKRLAERRAKEVERG